MKSNNIKNSFNGYLSNTRILSLNSTEKSKHKFPKKQAINFNSSQINQSKKSFQNNDKNNDIYNSQKYATQKVNKIKKHIKIPESDISQSRNFNKLNNNNSLSNTVMSSFSISNDVIINGNKNNNKKEYDLDKLRENGIKYCFDENGNPMDIIDIKTKKKIPIAFIIQTANKNILMDTNNTIISPTKNGDYALPHKPYIIIHKYDVIHPELRVIKPDKEENFIDSIIEAKLTDRRKNNKSTNFYDIQFKQLNRINGMSEENKNFCDNFEFFSPIIKSKIESYKSLNNNIKGQKRKYIFVNRLSNFNKSVQLNINKKEDNSISLSKGNDQLNNDNKTLKNYFSTQKNHLETLNNGNDANVTQLVDNKIVNKLLLQTDNKLKETKSFNEKKFNSDLEFKFERKYKSKNPLINPEKNASIKDNKETPNNKIDIKFDDYFNSNPDNTNLTRTKKILLFNKTPNSHLDINKFKRQRFSYSLNEFMLNPLLNSKQISTKVNNDINTWNTLSTFNQSLMTPNTEKSSYSTIQKVYNESEQNNSKKNSNIKNSFTKQYYLKPKLKTSKFFHKRINTENFSTEKNINFLQSIENKNNKNANKANYITPFSLTDVDFNSNKKIHDSNCNNSVCKCPYCHNLFFN